MSNTTKKTHRQFYTEILENPSLTTEQVAFLQGRISALDKKNSATGPKKKTPAQIENDATAMAIYEAMEPGLIYTVADVRKKITVAGALSPQKVSPIMKSLAEQGLVERTEYKEKHFHYMRPADAE